MREALSLMRAQVQAETLERLRSPASLITVLATLVLSFLWLPNPSKNVSSISWTGRDGIEYSGIYNPSYLGPATAILVASFLSLIGFYLIAGSVRRDRERGVGAILAATPLTNSAYLLGKAAAHFCYLLVLSAICLLTGSAVWLVYGTGSFSASAFLVPWLALVVPCLAVTAVLTVLFDVTPGLRGRSGLIIWFFFWGLALFAVPSESPQPRLAGHPVFDPVGLIGFERVLFESVPGAREETMSFGLQYHDKPVTRIDWAGVRFSWPFVAMRAAQLGWCLPLLLLSQLFFDRFDPARGRLRAHSKGFLARLRPRPAVVVEAGPAAVRHIGSLSAVTPSPSFTAALLAEARLVWDASPWLRWTLLIASLLGGFLPAPASSAAAAAFLLILAPVLSEVAARERLAGTDSLVYSQPAVPRSIVFWKFSSTLLFAGALALPLVVRALFRSPLHGMAFIVGIVFVASFAVSAGYITKGGKLFSGLYVALWYLALQRLEPADFCAVMSPDPTIRTRVVHIVISAVLLSTTLLVERLHDRPARQQDLPQKPGPCIRG